VNADAHRYGATQADWDHFTLMYLGLEEDLLPVVCKPGATISPRSSIKAPGKVPSQYNGNGELVGIPDWTRHRATAGDIGRWQGNGDYGICVQTRRVRALDVDVTDPELAARVAAFIEARYPGLPRRQRPNSSKFLLGDLNHFRLRQARHAALSFELAGEIKVRDLSCQCYRHNVCKVAKTNDGESLIGKSDHVSTETGGDATMADLVQPSISFDLQAKAVIDSFAVIEGSTS